MAHIDNFVKDAWDVKPSLTDKGKTFIHECSKNFPLEWKCVLACEAGDIVGTYGAVLAGSDHSNLWGYALGVTTGLLYAHHHIKKDAKHQRLNPSFREIGSAVVSAEVGCTVGATLVPAFLGAHYGLSTEDIQILTQQGINHVQDLAPIAKDLAIRAGSFIPALPVGMAAMSFFTLKKKSEVTRLVAEKGKLPKIADVLGKDYCVVNYDDQENHNIMINGRKSNVTITEEPIPVMYGNLFDPDKNSLYRVTSPAARYIDDARKSAYGLACNVFDLAGLKNHSHPERLGDHNHAHNHGEEGNHSHKDNDHDDSHAEYHH